MHSVEFCSVEITANQILLTFMALCIQRVSVDSNLIHKLCEEGAPEMPTIHWLQWLFALLYRSMADSKYESFSRNSVMMNFEQEPYRPMYRNISCRANMYSQSDNKYCLLIFDQMIDVHNIDFVVD